MRDLRVRFGLILAMALLPLLVFSVWHSARDFETASKSRYFAMEQTTQSFAKEFVDTIELAKAVLRSTVALDIEENCAASLSETLEEFSRFTQLKIYDGVGAFQCSAREIYTADLENYVSDFSVDDPFVIDTHRVVTGDRAGQKFLIVLYADYDGGDIANIFMVVANVSEFLQLDVDDRNDKGVRAAIIDNQGNVLLDSDDSFDRIETEWIETATSEKTFESVITDKDGDKKFIYIIPTDEPEILMAASQPKLKIFSRSALSPAVALIVPLFAWVFAFAAIWMATNRLFLTHLKPLGDTALEFADGRYDRRVGELNDAPSQMRELASAFDTMADRVSSRDAELKQSLSEKEQLLREIHHRVKNNLQMIISLLNIQKRELQDPVYDEAINDTRNRINAIALVHKALYESDDIEDVPMPHFLTQLIRQASRTLGTDKKGIRVSVDIDMGPRTGDRATAMAMFIIEAMTNAVKHGVPRGGHVHISAHDRGDKTIITVNDDGTNATAATDKKGTGDRLMQGFARQLSGQYSVGKTVDGYVCTLSCPKDMT